MRGIRRRGGAGLLTATMAAAAMLGAPVAGAAASTTPQASGVTCTDTYSGGSTGSWVESTGWSSGAPQSGSDVCITSGSVVVPNDYGSNGYVIYDAGSISISQGATLAIADEDLGSLYLNATSVSNAGTIELNGGANGNSSLAVSGTMTNSGTFDVPDDVQPSYSLGGALFLYAHSFTNTGALTVESPAGFTIGASDTGESYSGGTYTNQGTITTQSSRDTSGAKWYGSMGFASSSDLVQQGTITNEVSGTLNVSGELDVEGGSLCSVAPIQLGSGTLHFGTPAAVAPTCAKGQAADTVNIDPTTNTNTLAATLSGTVPSEYKVIVGEADSGGGYDVNATGAVNDGRITIWGGYNGQNELTAQGTFTNKGTVDLPNDSANAALLEMETFDNAGTLSVEEANGRVPVVFEGPAAESGTLDNTGTVNVDGGIVSFNVQSGKSTTLLSKSGSIKVSGGGSLTDNGTLSVEGGSVCTSTDLGLTDTASITFATSVPSGPACASGLISDTVDAGINSTTVLRGTVPKAWTIDIGSAGNGGATTLSAPAPAVNDGTIVLHGGYNGTVTLSAPSGFTNNGTVTSPDANTNLTAITTKTFTNSGTLDDDGGRLTLNGNLSDAGKVILTDVGLTVTGAFTVGTNGVVEDEGSTSSGLGSLAVGPGSKLGGWLDLVVPAGQGSTGQQATIVSGSGLTGTFKHSEVVRGASGTNSAEYFSEKVSSSSYVLTVIGVAKVKGPASAAPGAKLSASVTGYPATTALTFALTDAGTAVGQVGGTTGASGAVTVSFKVAASARVGTATLTTTAKSLGLTITQPVKVS